MDATHIPIVLDKNTLLNTLQEAIKTIRKSCRSENYDGVEYGFPRADKKICVNINKHEDKLGLDEIVCTELRRVWKKRKHIFRGGLIEFDFNSKKTREIIFDIDEAAVPLDLFDAVTSPARPDTVIELSSFVSPPLIGRPESYAPYKPKHLKTASTEERIKLSKLINTVLRNSV